MTDTYNYIIYHSGCFDGFTGFYLFTKSGKMEKKPVVYPDYPSTDKVPPGIEGKNVISIDVAYKPWIVEKIAKKANKFLFIDHHITHQRAIQSLQLPVPHEVVYQIDRCGATLVWEYFFPNKPKPEFVKMIEDNDLGRWQLPDTLNFIAGLEVKHRLKPNFDILRSWDNLLAPSYLKKLIIRGRHYNEYKTKMINLQSRRAEFLKFPSKKLIKKLKLDIPSRRVGVLNGGGVSVSLVGKKIAEDSNCEYALIWRYSLSEKKFIFSFRSISTDVEVVARAFGGGGHKLAAGAAISGAGLKVGDLFDPLHPSPKNT